MIETSVTPMFQPKDSCLCHQTLFLMRGYIGFVAPVAQLVKLVMAYRRIGLSGAHRYLAHTAY